MKILYFSWSVTDHDRRFTEALAGDGHAVHYLSLDGAGRPAPSLPEGVAWEAWPAGYGPAAPESPGECLAAMPAFTEVLERVDPDVVHAGPVPTSAFMTSLSERRPYLAMSWGSDVLVHAARDPGWDWATRHALEAAECVVTDCATVTERVMELGGMGRGRVIQFPWGTDLDRFTPAPPPSEPVTPPFAEDDEVVVLLSTRPWEPLYGTDTLVDAFRRAYERDARLRLVLLGGGSLATRIETIIGRHGLEGVIARPGRVPHEALPSYFRSADLYVSCALSDGTSVSLLEAMATGTPVLVTDNPSNREWVEPGENGWLAGADAADRFAEAMLAAGRLAPGERLIMSRRNRAVAERRANWSLNVRKLLDAYRRLAEEAEPDPEPELEAAVVPRPRTRTTSRDPNRPRTAAIIQARMGSTRLPGKVLEDLLGQPVLVRVVERTRRSSMLDDVVVATTEAPEDEAIVALCRERGYPFTRGSEPDVLDRYHQAAIEHHVDVVVRITADCPLIFPEHIDEAVRLFFEAQPVDYVSNRLPPRVLPSGTDVEVFWFETLERAWKEDDDPASREHVVPYAYHHPERFDLRGIHEGRDLSALHLSVDTPEDLALIRRIYEHFGHDRFGWEAVVEALVRYPQWLRLNGSPPVPPDPDADRPRERDRAGTGRA